MINALATWLFEHGPGRRAARLPAGERAGYFQRSAKSYAFGAGMMLIIGVCSVGAAVVWGYAFFSYPTSPLEYPAGLLSCASIFHVLFALLCGYVAAAFQRVAGLLCTGTSEQAPR